MPLVALDARLTRRMSLGMQAYVTALRERLPRVAPDLTFRFAEGGENFGLDEQLRLPRRLRGADLVHFPTIYAPVRLPRRYVVTIHDLLHVQFPALFARRVALYYRTLARRLARGARRLIVGDARTVALCEEHLGVPASRCRVVPLGYDPAILAATPWHAERPYVLYVGNHRPHKDLATLVAAWRALPPGCVLDLAVTGPADLGVPAQIGERRFLALGTLGPTQLAERLRGARALVHPALSEGFGLPILEALALGTPVIACEDAVPGGLAPFVATHPARDRERLGALLEEAAHAPEAIRRLASEGEAVARAYTWDAFAASTAAVYREALEDGP